ncbi:MAG TPA: hypothetical protein VMM78_12235 [Thermomicrobiales bacterium]|nr:hypothetical protein [Thermomicrobiales bacterium]
MQTTQTTRPLSLGPISRAAVALGLIGSLLVGAATIAGTDRWPLIDRAEPATVSAPSTTSNAPFALEAQQANAQAGARQVTSDALFALEAGLAGAQVDHMQSSMAQTRSDEAWALETSLVAKATTHRHSQMRQITLDEAWATGQRQLLAGDPEQRVPR